MQLQPRLTHIGKNVLDARYLDRNSEGKIIETPQLRYERVAKHIAKAEELYGNNIDEIWPIFYTIMAKGDFLPNTPCLANAGKPHGTNQFSACFVLPIEDSMDGIFNTLRHMALVHQSGGGTGFSFSNLRPLGDFVRSTAGVASGPVSFLEIYNNICDTVKQGSVRPGANMGILRVDHPDILKFIQCKADVEKIKNFNISIGITDAFMKAFENDTYYNLINPRTNLVVDKISAKTVWQLIIKNAWLTGDPGLFFIDRVNQVDPLSDTALGSIEATNPCGEVPLRPYDACTLGSINLSNFFVLKNNKPTIDFDRLSTTIQYSVQFLDDVLDMNQYPISEIYEVTRASRKIGLGVMGWSDLLIKLHIPYQSEQALHLASNIMQFINNNAVKASEALAKDRGPFPLFDKSKWKEKNCKPRRNSTVTVIAPTGSISILAGCSSGIEPTFALCQTRRQAGYEMTDFNTLLEEIAKQEGFWSDELKEIVSITGSVQSTNIPEQWKEIFRIASEIDVETHVKMQAAFQEHVEDAVSKTINMVKDATEEDVDTAYRLSWALNCKGITIYRDGSRPNQTLSTGKIETTPKSRRTIPENGRRSGETITKPTAYGSVHVIINRHPDDNEPFELWVQMSKPGNEIKAFSEALGRIASLTLKSSVDPTYSLSLIAEQLSDIVGSESIGYGDNQTVSVVDAVSHAIRDFLDKKDKKVILDICPDCKQSSLAKGGKCDVCTTCGYSKC